MVTSNTREHGKKFEITGNDGDDIKLPSPVEITEVGSISGEVTLQNQIDNTGIMVYIPGTSFMALTDVSGSFTISSIPEGTYLILRAEKDGYNYSALSNITVQSSKTTTVANQMLLISTGAKGSILINNGIAISTSRTIDINISATDNAVLMTIAEEPTFQNTSWIPIQSYTTHIFTSDGDKTLYIKFADANGLESTTYSDSITIDTNPRVTLSSPSGTISLTKPTLTWTASTLPNPKYHVQVSTDSTFSSIPEEATNLTSTSYALTNILSNAATYYYRVSIIDENGREWNWSDTEQFTIDLSAVTLTSPSNSSITSDTTPTFSWSSNSNAVTYNLVVSTNSDLSSPVINKTGITETSFTDTVSLTNTAGTTYYWAVTPVDTNEVSGTRSSIYSFTLDTTAPTGSIVINDGVETTVSTDITLTLSATDAAGVTGYCTPGESSIMPENNDSCWTSFTTTTSYLATVSFTLSSGDGTKTVYVWFRDAAGNVSTVASDSITLDTIIASVSNITDASATLNASFSNVSGASVTVHFEYGTTADYGTTTSAQAYSSSSVSASANLTNLNGGTTYHYRVVVVYNDSTVQTGMDHSFTTLVTPTTLLGGANNIATMTLNGGSLYWIDSSGLKSIACAGCQATTITGSVTSGGHLQVNGTAAYWTDSTYDPNTGQTSYIKTIPLTGGSISTLVMTTVKYYIADMKVDSSSIYWIDYYSTDPFSGDASLNGSGGLRKIPLDGGTTTTIASTNYGSYIALDGSSVYWTDNSGLHKADKNGGTLTVLDSNLSGNLTVDSTSIYVGGSQAIYKMPLQGGTSTMLADSSEFASLTIILSDGLNVYWGGVIHPPHLGNYQIDKVTSTGGSSTLIASGTDAFGGIVDMSLDDANIYWSTSSEIKKLSK